MAWWKNKAYWIAVSLIVVIGAYVLFLRQHRGPVTEPPDFREIPRTVGSWQGEEQILKEWEYEVLQADQSVYIRYVHPTGRIIWLFIGYFQNQKYGAQIHSPKNCLPGGGWRIAAQKRYRLSDTNGSSAGVPVTYLHISNEREQDVVLYWFATRGGEIANELQLKFDLLVSTLLYRPTSAAFIRFHTAVTNGDAERSRVELESFAKRLLPSIKAILDQEFSS